MSFHDHAPLSTDEAQKIYKKRYPRLQFAGRNHGLIQKIRHLYKNTRPNPDRLCGIEGIWGAEQLLAAGIRPKILLICPERIYTAKAQQLVDTLASKAEDFLAVSGKVFDAVSEDPSAAGILCVFPFRFSSLQSLPDKKALRIIVMDGIEIQGNAGTILRSADAAGFDAAIFSNRKIRINHPKLIRASMGSALTVPIIEAGVEEFARFARDKNIQVLLADTEGARPYHLQSYAARAALVVGSEKYGLHKDWYGIGADAVFIPMLGAVDSLNVAIAATVLMYKSIEGQ